MRTCWQGKPVCNRTRGATGLDLDVRAASRERSREKELGCGVFVMTELLRALGILIKVPWLGAAQGPGAARARLGSWRGVWARGPVRHHVMELLFWGVNKDFVGGVPCMPDQTNWCVSNVLLCMSW